jgi:tetratricopeptide (TPR) repeat protein
LGNIFFYKKDFVTARKHYEEAVKINPQLCDPWNNLGNICFEQGDFIKAEEFYSNAVRCSPNNPYFHGGLGKALLKQDKLDLAIASYKKALEINPNLSDIKKVLINIYIILGERQQQSGDMEKACEYFQEATKIDNQNVLLYNKIAGIKLMLNDYVGACSVYETCKKNCKDIDLSKYPNFSRFQL